jgi:single-stranded-DNA-specific exonuclease
MDNRRSRWSCEPYDVSAALRLCEKLGVAMPVAAVLVRRGLAAPGEARRFLEASDRHDPLGMGGMPEACELVMRHLGRGSRIAVYGDYDVDGVCSTAMLVRTLRRLGGDPSWELPSRFAEGYGLSPEAVERLARRGTDLLVTVDCAITAVEEVAAARAAGIDVVVTDHHRPAERLPDAPVVHPALGGYACPDLCASGVVLKLSEALHRAAGHDPRRAEDDLDLAALATVCDLVPLRGENRRIVREGLRALAGTAKPGLRALMAVAGVEPAEIREQALGFRLGPRLNAAGRMQRADAALELLLTEDHARAEEVARELDLLNRDRQEAETRMLFEADAACAAQASSAALVVAGDGWHPGVVGIVASRLVERHHRPCVVIALDGEGGRGSGRSIAAYDLHEGLAACAAHLRRFGGHRAAAGIEIDRTALGAFRRALSRHAGEALAPEDLVPVERIDAVVPGGALGLPLAEELERLRPFGLGNPQPTLLVPAARLEAVAGMGEDRQHARFVVATGGSRSRGVAFGSPPRSLSRTGGEPHDLAVRLEPNRWNGRVEPRLLLRALCPSRRGPLRVLGEHEPFWTRLERALGEDLAAWPEPAPAREQRDRRGEGFAGVVGDLLTSGAHVLVAVAGVERRRESLESLVAGLCGRPLAVASWEALAAQPELAAPFEQLVALDPPPSGPAFAAGLPGPPGAFAHLAWSPADAEFALALWRSELELRPGLADLWRRLRDLGAPGPRELEEALRGGGRYPRSATACARLLRVLAEVGLIEYVAADAGGPRVEAAPDPGRVELELSASYRDCAERLGAIEQALASELVPPAVAVPA